MKSLRTIVAVLLLAIFSLTSSHALLEGLELIHEDGDHNHAQGPASSSHDAADGICRIDSHRAEFQKLFSDAPTELSQFFALNLFLLQQNSQERGREIGISGSPPLEFATTWQFSSRTALPARAPSIAS